MAHKGHPRCEFTSKAKCDRARQEAIGRCSAMTEKLTDCTNWGVERVNGRAFCGQHYLSILYREMDAKRIAERHAAMTSSIDAYLLDSGQVAHQCGEVCYFSIAIQGPRLSDLQVEAPAGPHLAP